MNQLREVVINQNLNAGNKLTTQQGVLNNLFTNSSQLHSNNKHNFSNEDLQTLNLIKMERLRRNNGEAQMLENYNLAADMLDSSIKSNCYFHYNNYNNNNNFNPNLAKFNNLINLNSYFIYKNYFCLTQFLGTKIFLFRILTH